MLLTAAFRWVLPPGVAKLNWALPTSSARRDSYTREFANHEHKRKYKKKRKISIRNHCSMTSFEFYVNVSVSVCAHNSQIPIIIMNSVFCRICDSSQPFGYVIIASNRTDVFIMLPPREHI